MKRSDLGHDGLERLAALAGGWLAGFGERVADEGALALVGVDQALGFQFADGAADHGDRYPVLAHQRLIRRELAAWRVPAGADVGAEGVGDLGVGGPAGPVGHAPP